MTMTDKCRSLYIVSDSSSAYNILDTLYIVHMLFLLSFQVCKSKLSTQLQHYPSRRKVAINNWGGHVCASQLLLAQYLFKFNVYIK